MTQEMAQEEPLYNKWLMPIATLIFFAVVPAFSQTT
jgi:hypothetical protein